MKKNLLLLLAVSLLFLTKSLDAQINEGGTPLGYNQPIGSVAIPFEIMSAVNVDSLKADDAIRDTWKDVPYRFGSNHFVHFNPDNSGIWTKSPNGDNIWQLGIECPNALSINIAFDQYKVPHGARLYIYRTDRTQLIGAFTDRNNQSDNELGCDLMRGSSIIVEYDEPANVAFHGQLDIFRITHGYRDVIGLALKSYGQSGSCQNNSICAANWQLEKRCVACIVSGGSEICTGSLVNDVPNDGTPYFLTANHCGSSGFGTWVFRFNWESPNCTPSSNGPTTQSVSGAVQRAVNANSDFDLLELNTVPPSNYNVYYAGWNNQAIIADSATCIHHPSGDIKKISFANNQTQDAGMVDEGNGPADCWRVGQWTNGCTEPGSSGSPLFDQNHRVIGQLYGGPSACGVAPASMYDVYGKFSTSWAYGPTPATRLKEWLDPGNTGALTNNGFDPNAPALTLDAGILNIISTVTGTSCVNSITPSVTLKNYGINTLINVTINYQLDAATPSTYTWNGSLVTNATAIIPLPTFVATAGAHTYTVFTSNPNGGVDLNTLNDSHNVAFTVIVASPVVTVPLTEGFESTTFPPTNFSITNPDGLDAWMRDTAESGFGNSTACAKFDNITNTHTGQLDDLNFPYIDFSNTTAPISLTFSVAYRRRTTNSRDSLFLLVSTDCGVTSTRYYAKGGGSLATVTGNLATAFVPTPAQWRTDTVNLDALAGIPNVYMTFENKSNHGNNLYIDDINLTGNLTTGQIAPLSLNIYNLFPNPTTGQLHIAMQLLNKENVVIHVRNILGEEMLTQNIGNTMGGEYLMDLSRFAKGTYFVQFISGKESIARILVKE